MALRHTARILALLLLTFEFAIGNGFAQKTSAATIDDALRMAPAGSVQHVIIRVRPGAQPFVRTVIRRHGNRVLKEHPSIDALTAVMRAADLRALASDPTVLSISLDAPVETAAKRTTSSTSSGVVSFIRDVLGIGTAVAGSTSTVAVIDSGIEANDDFAGRLLGQLDFVDGAPGIFEAPMDAYGHGTHVAGLIASSGVLSGGKYAGVASAARLVSLKVLDKNGKGRTSDVIAALDWIVRNKAIFGINIVNLSLGHPIYEPATTDPLVLAVEQAVRSGLVVVVAAGNYGTNPKTGLTGYAGITSPGNAPSAITVGAVNSQGTVAIGDDTVARYSSRGPTWYDGVAKPDLVAPGHMLISDAADSSSLEAEYPDFIVAEPSKNFLVLSGSSMATAVVSGVTALMFDANRMGAEQRARGLFGGRYVNKYWTPPAPLTSNAIKALLQYTAFPLTDPSTLQPYDPLTQGGGEIDAMGALYSAYYIDTTARAGSRWTTADLPRTTTTSAGETLAWSQNIVWGTTLESGSGLLDVRQFAWGDTVVWGTSDDNIVWGTLDAADNIVWGTSIVEGSDVVWAGSVSEGDNIVWGTAAWDDNIVWGIGLIGSYEGDNIVWGTFDGGDNIVWGTVWDDNIVWGTDAKIRALICVEGGN